MSGPSVWRRNILFEVRRATTPFCYLLRKWNKVDLLDRAVVLRRPPLSFYCRVGCAWQVPDRSYSRPGNHDEQHHTSHWHGLHSVGHFLTNTACIKNGPGQVLLWAVLFYQVREDYRGACCRSISIAIART